MFDMSHLHPMIVHFPIALLLVGFVLDLAGLISRRDFFIKAGFLLLILGSLGVVAAYFSGDVAADTLTKTDDLQQALEIHEESAEITLGLMAGVSIFRIGLVLLKKFKGAFCWVVLGLFALGVISVVRTAYFGGTLVFKHAAGVRTIETVGH